MQWLKVSFIILVLALTSACSSWVYRINVPQGNFLEQSDVDKLRVGMTQEQVIFVLGRPVADNAFDDTKWHYVYRFNLDRANEQKRSLVVHFDKQQRLKSISGDYETPADFNTPLEGN